MTDKPKRAYTSGPVDVFLVWGPDPEDEEAEGQAVLEVFVDSEKDAEVYLSQGLMALVQDRIRKLKPGGTVSLLATRGRPPSGDDMGSSMTASFAVNNPGGKRMDYEFRVERRRAEVKGL